MTSQVKIGIIGGTGLDNADLLESRQEKFVDTPFGKPSDALIIGKIKGIECVLLSRHGRHHTINPTNVNYRANIWAMKEEGCSHLVVTTACGSLQENVHPGDIVVLDQFVDRTNKRQQTFFDGGPSSPPGVCHIPMAQPFCPQLTKLINETLVELELSHHSKGTCVTIEGPRFSSKAESKIFRSWDCTIVNMTTVPEVVLAGELGMSYGALALVTDYDCWKEGEEVNVANVMKIMTQNSKNALKAFLSLIPKIAEEDWTVALKGYQDTIKISTLLPH